MPDAPVATPPTGGAQQQQQRTNWQTIIWQMVMMYFMYTYFFKGNSKSAVPTTDVSGKTLPPLKNGWIDSQKFNLKVYMTENVDFTDYDNSKYIIWEEKNLFYDWSESNDRYKELTIFPSEKVKNNGTLYAHAFFTQAGYPHNPKDDGYNELACIHQTRMLNKYAPPKKIKTEVNLITGLEEIKEKEILDAPLSKEFVSYWKPNLTLHLIHDLTRYPRGSIPPQIEPDMEIDNETSTYKPIVFWDDFWTLQEHLIPINDTIKNLSLTVSYSSLSLLRWQMYLQMQQSFTMQRDMGAAGDGEADDFKRMLSDTNPYLLGLTFFVTILHSIFDFLAFKNDINFWKNKKNLEGMSVRTMFVNLFCQVVIFFYLMDNDTSWLILISSGIGLAIEFWKIRKAVVIKVDWTRRFPITYEDRESYSSKTREYDEQAMKYLSWVLFPLVIGYAIYSLMYNTHKSWYSWILSSLTGCVYTFGFITMCPQLFINYKLKSVAHLPWRAFTYKALNTFIDDLFAFIIKMPTLHRLSCFRDDLIFLVYLYQRWVYRVDYSRVNEFGQGGDDNVDGVVDITKKEAIENKNEVKTKTLENKKDK